MAWEEKLAHPSDTARQAGFGLTVYQPVAVVERRCEDAKHLFVAEFIRLHAAKVLDNGLPDRGIQPGQFREPAPADTRGLLRVHIEDAEFTERAVFQVVTDL